MTSGHKLTISLLPTSLAVCRLASDARLPAWADTGNVIFIARTPDELSVVATDDLVPPDVRAERGWRAFKLEGPFDFALTGVLASVLQPLAEAAISIFAVSTFDTDYVLVKTDSLSRATEVLRAVGHTVRG